MYYDAAFTLSGFSRSPLLPRVLQALLPPGCGELAPPTRLDLSCCELCHVAQACTQLASVQVLRLCNCYTCSGVDAAGEGSDTVDEFIATTDELPICPAALSALLQQLPALTDLSLEECLGALDAYGLPPSLTRLSLRGNDLDDLPYGTYPEGEACAPGLWQAVHVRYC